MLDLACTLFDVGDQRLTFLARLAGFRCSGKAVNPLPDFAGQVVELKGEAPTELLPLFRREQHAEGKAYSPAEDETPYGRSSNSRNRRLFHVLVVVVIGSNDVSRCFDRVIRPGAATGCCAPGASTRPMRPDHTKKLLPLNDSSPVDESENQTSVPSSCVDSS